MIDIGQPERFDDVGESDVTRHLDYAYRGYHYRVSCGAVTFLARTYDDEPGQVTVVSPANALSLPEAHDLAQALLQRLKATRILFYSRDRGTYVPVNPVTMHFES